MHSSMVSLKAWELVPVRWEVDITYANDEVPPCGIERMGLSAAIHLHPVDNKHYNMHTKLPSGINTAGIKMWGDHSGDERRRCILRQISPCLELLRGLGHEKRK